MSDFYFSPKFDYMEFRKISFEKYHKRYPSVVKKEKLGPKIWLKVLIPLSQQLSINKQL